MKIPTTDGSDMDGSTLVFTAGQSPEIQSLIGRELAGHRVLEMLGRGGMGEVYLAEDIQLKRLVALKVLPVELAEDEERLARFRREAEALAKLNHPGIVRIYGFHVADGLCFFTMERVEGTTLDMCFGSGLPAGDLSLDAFFELALKLIDAVDAAHEHGIVHRDLKPGNVMVTPEGHVRVLDFGLVKLRGAPDPPERQADDGQGSPRRDHAEPLTRAGAIFGTVAYMAPEQVEGKVVDRRTDIYALGVIFFEMLTGRRPFQKSSMPGMFHAILNESPRLPESELIPGRLRDLVLRCLEKNPEARFAAAAKLGEEIELLRRRVNTARERRRKLRIAAGSAAVLFTVMLLLTSWALRNAYRAQQETERTKDQVLLAMANDVDRTTGVLLLKEISRPDEVSGLTQRMLDLSQGAIAWEQFGHERTVHKLAFRPDGRTLLSGSADHTARLWSLDDLQNPAIFAGHQNVIWDLDLDQEGRVAATASFDGTVRVWNLERPGEEPLVLDVGEGHVWTVDLSADGRRLVAGSWNGTTHFWNLADSQDAKSLKGDGSQIWTVRISPDGGSVLLGTDSGRLRLWDLASGVVRDLPGHQRTIYSSVFSPDGRFALTASWDGTAGYWDLADLSRSRFLRGHEGRLWSVRFSPDGKRGLTSSWDGTARVWDLEDLSRPPLVLRGHGAGVILALFHPEATHVLTVSEDQTSRYWNLAEPEHPRVFEGLATTAAISADGSLAAIGSQDGRIRLWRLDSTHALENPRTLRVADHPIVSAAFSPDGRRIATGSSDGTSSVRRAEDFSLLHHFSGQTGSIMSVCFSPDGTHVATGSLGGSVYLRGFDGDGAATEPVRLKGHDQSVWAVDFHPRGHRLLTASEDGTVKIWNVDAPDEALEVLDHQELLFSATYSPDGRKIATTTSHQATYLWSMDDPGNPVVLHRFEDFSGPVFYAQFSPEGERLVVSSFDGSARIWDLKNPEAPPRILRGHGSGVVAVDFHPDGHSVVTGAWDRTARVWNLKDPENPLILAGHEDRLTTTVFSPDGSRILTIALDGTARLWTYRKEDLQADLFSATRIRLDANPWRLYLGGS